jgi:hypothetical protein
MTVERLEAAVKAFGDSSQGRYQVVAKIEDNAKGPLLTTDCSDILAQIGILMGSS